MTTRAPVRTLNTSNWDLSFAPRLSLLTVVFGEVRDVKYCNVVEKLAAFYTLWRQIIDSISFERQTRIWSFLQCFCLKFILCYIWICLALKLLSTNTWSKNYRQIHVIENEQLSKTQTPPIDSRVGGNHYTTKWPVRKSQPSPPILLSSIFQTEYSDLAAISKYSVCSRFNHFYFQTMLMGTTWTEATAVQNPVGNSAIQCP